MCYLSCKLVLEMLMKVDIYILRTISNNKCWNFKVIRFGFEKSCLVEAPGIVSLMTMFLVQILLSRISIEQ